jgi:hypothetical protein
MERERERDRERNLNQNLKHRALNRDQILLRARVLFLRNYLYIYNIHMFGLKVKFLLKSCQYVPLK